MIRIFGPVLQTWDSHPRSIESATVSLGRFIERAECRIGDGSQFDAWLGCGTDPQEGALPRTRNKVPWSGALYTETMSADLDGSPTETRPGRAAFGGLAAWVFLFFLVLYASLTRGHFCIVDEFE